jgi:hypothetical protein
MNHTQYVANYPKARHFVVENLLTPTIFQDKWAHFNTSEMLLTSSKILHTNHFIMPLEMRALISTHSHGED